MSPGEEPADGGMRLRLTVRGSADDIASLVAEVEARDLPDVHLLDEGAADGTLYSRTVESLTLLVTSPVVLHQVRSLIVTWLQHRRIVLDIDLPDAGSIHYEGPLRTQKEVEAVVQTLADREPPAGG